MKITNFAILFVVIVFPFMYINQMHAAAQNTALSQEIHYNAALDAAVQDAAEAMTFNEKQEFEAGYGSMKKYRANKEEAIEAFLHTLYLNFGIQNDPIAQGVLQQYIPVVVVIDYDGYYVYSPQEYTNAKGETELKHVWSDKKPFAWSDQNHNSLAFSLDDYVVAYDSVSKTWQAGRRGDINGLVNISLLNDASTFDQVRRTTIVNAIQNELEYVINQDNTYAKKYGIDYTFTIPQISQEEWNNTINDIGVMAFIQGVPVGDRYYNNYALGGSRIFKKAVIVGATAPDGKKYYYRSTCSYPYTPTETFTTEKEAAENGYVPLSCTNGQ